MHCSSLLKRLLCNGEKEMDVDIIYTVLYQTITHVIVALIVGIAVTLVLAVDVLLCHALFLLQRKLEPGDKLSIC